MTDDQPEHMFDVKRYAALIPVSEELLMEYGVIPDTRPPVVIPWRHRVRWAFSEFRHRVGLRVGSWIAGRNLDYDPSDD